MKRAILIFLASFGLVLSACGLQAPQPVGAGSPKDEVCAGVGLPDGTGDCSGGPSISQVMKNIVNVFSIIIGIAAVIMLMVGGFKYVTAGGEASNITSAKHTIVYAILGLVVAALSQAIVWFVLDRIE